MADVVVAKNGLEDVDNTIVMMGGGYCPLCGGSI